MSKNTLMIAGVALLLAVGALVLQFVMPAGTGATEADLDALRAEVAQVKASGAGSGVRIGYVDAEDAFTVFILAVGDLREQIAQKNEEITALRSDYAQGIVARDEYERSLYQLNAELLDARVTTAAGTLDRMIASARFSDLRSQLVGLREEAQPLVDEVNSLVATIRVGAIDATEFQNRYQTLSALFEQFDQMVTAAASTKLVQAIEKIAHTDNYDLIIRKKDVVMYRNSSTIQDITDRVKAEIRDYL